MSGAHIVMVGLWMLVKRPLSSTSGPALVCKLARPRARAE